MAGSPSDRPADGAWTKPRLQRLFDQPGRFVVAAELVTSSGVIREERPRRILSLARELAAHPRIDVLSITDNPGGRPMLSAETLGTDMIQRGQEVIIHLTCKDQNRNALQSRGWRLASEGFHNVLALTGDYPVAGYGGTAAPVFDIDSVGLLRLLSDMNAGAGAVSNGSGGATEFLLGCVVNNHKRFEREVVPQYLKLRKKIENGARFVINQIGYDARKDDELLRWMAEDGHAVPVLANVFVLTPGAARIFNAGRIPGVVVTDELLALVEQKDRAFFLELASKQVAIARGLGFRGVYIGGRLEVDDYEHILMTVDSYAPDDWRAFAKEVRFPFPDEYYWFERDPETGLSGPALGKRSKGRAPARYRLSRRMHALVFDPDARLFGTGRSVYSAVERRPPAVRKTLHGLEQLVKVPMFACKDCGDCSLPDVAYLCPESHCVKNQRNGPCGGTREGKCEVGDKDCIWALAYERLQAFSEEETMLDGPAVVNDNGLRGTSAWANTFLGRDHHGGKDPS
jgi:methylenetetrahydrofolate reductase (NADPH)